MQSTPLAMLVMFVFALFAQPSVEVDQKTRTHDGVVISATAGKLTMSDKDGKNEHSHEVTLIAKVTLNGQPAQLAQLMKGDMVSVTMDPEGKVISVAAMRSAN
jgi:hypothetical protein